MPMRISNKRTVVIVATVLGFLSITVLGYFGYEYFCERNIKSVAVKYLNLLDTSTIESLESNTRAISTASFMKRNISNIKEDFKTHQKINANVDKILLVDRRKAALEAVVYYTAHPEGQTYSTPEQLNLVMYKEQTGWKVQDAYFMERSDQPIPENSDVERSNQIKRYDGFLTNVNNFLRSRENGDLDQYLDLFSENADINKFSKLFSEEQQYLHDKNLKLTLISNGLLVDSSTDLEGLATLLLTQVIGKESISIPLKFKFVYEAGEWKISDIIR